jgi:TolA-binding protein
MDRDAFVEQAKKQLDDWNAQIDKLQAQMERQGEDARRQQEQALREMEANRDKAEKRLAEMQEAGRAAWEDMRGAVERSMADLASAWETARKRF